MSMAHPIVDRLVKAYRPMQQRGLLLDGRLPLMPTAPLRGVRRNFPVALVVPALARYFNQRSSSC